MAISPPRFPLGDVDGSKSPLPLDHGQRPWFVYLLLCRGNRLYAGVTPDVEKRMEKHRMGTGARFTRCHPPEFLLAVKRFDSKAAAMTMEYRVKQLSAEQKRALAQVWRADGGADQSTLL